MSDTGNQLNNACLSNIDHMVPIIITQSQLSHSAWHFSFKKIILKGSERKKESGKENSQAPCSSLFADLSVFNVSFTKPRSKKKKRQLHLLPGKAKLTDEWHFWQQRDRKWERKAERERRGTRKWNVIGSHTRSNLATCQSTSCLIRRRSEAPGRRAVSQDDTLCFMNEASGGPAARLITDQSHFTLMGRYWLRTRPER